MKTTFCCFIFTMMICSCNSEMPSEKKTEQPEIEQKQETQPVTQEQQTKQQMSVSTSDAAVTVNAYKDSLGWGYDVLINEKVSIHQPMIPAVPGNQGFATESDAKKVGELMLYKIKNKIMPPSIDVRELDSLGIKYRK